MTDCREKWHSSQVPSDDEDTSKQETATDKVPAHLDPENMEFGLGQVDIETLKKAIFAGAAQDDADDDKGEEEIGDEDVAKVEAMMRKLQAAREAGETMSETQRRKMAAKAVEEVMREL
ncbi:hypothetical protein NLG97_g9643 [Lecanicillium saksenae]|uniref:Uncharacterized protein n=1 Tax=Lecanicillium saksenae TaxID=468837 RepID=A0ACC1QFY8_9HYPO|nr:hypothetical protein NLG97_g9643 [Lecanicillium saksenae]